jgi:predicted esterase
MKTMKVSTLVTILFIAHTVLGQQIKGSGDTLTLIVKTYDGLELPAQVINNNNHGKKMILFINGSTPYDEKGNLGAGWNDKGKIIMQKHDFYIRFLDIMSNKGYPIATIAKRSFSYPTRIPRPNLTDLALDIFSYIEELKRCGSLKDEKDLVIIGYSEGSIIASKVLGMLKKQPYACILLGSATFDYDCNNPSIEGFSKADVLRRLRNLTDEQIETEFNRLCKIQKALLSMDEEEFENEYKKSRPFGVGFAMWESLNVHKQLAFYDPIPNLLYANIPILICIGEDDLAMPMTSAKKLYQRLKNRGLDVSFSSIAKEVHQYKKYDVFPIIDTWLSSNFQSTDFILQKSDSMIIERYRAMYELTDEISAIPYGGGYPEKIIKSFEKAIERNLSDASIWFTLGLKLFADNYHNEAFTSFSKATDSTFFGSFGSLVWMGHIKDLNNKRNDAVAYYQKALDVYPGFPIQHDNWKMVIDKAWIEERIKFPFTGVDK